MSNKTSAVYSAAQVKNPVVRKRELNSVTGQSWTSAEEAAMSAAVESAPRFGPEKVSTIARLLCARAALGGGRLR